MHRQFCRLFLAMFGMATGSSQATSELPASRQCVVVLTESWAATTGVLHKFERQTLTDSWKRLDAGVPVVVGRKGLGRGVGSVSLDFADGPKKREGDDRAPAGVFRLSAVFGHARADFARWVRLPYLAVTDQIEAIDDPRSRHYNRLVDRSKVAPDWRSSERMLRSGGLYKWGVVVDHNVAAMPGAGSCIFLHVWESPFTPTSGCTAMGEQNLVRLIRWLDPSRRPILVQMPRAAYSRIPAKWGLPRHL